MPNPDFCHAQQLHASAPLPIRQWQARSRGCYTSAAAQLLLLCPAAVTRPVQYLCFRKLKGKVPILALGENLLLSHLCSYLFFLLGLLGLLCPAFLAAASCCAAACAASIRGRCCNPEHNHSWNTHFSYPSAASSAVCRVLRIGKQARRD